MRDCVIGTRRFAFAATNTLFPVNDGLSVDDGNGALGTSRHARFRDTAAALIGDFIDVILAFIACGGNYLH